jgi:uncharacterized protein
MAAAMIAGMALGFVGSFHCIGMCGPLALSLPVQHLGGPQKLLAYLAYNLGRVATYTLLGLLLGLAGSGFNTIGWQQGFSIVVGSILLLLSLLYFLFRHRWQPVWWRRASAALAQSTQQLVMRSYKGGFFLIGMANGLLPCGMVYMAVATALAMGSAAQSALLMAGFGLATLPNMLLLGLLGMGISLPVRNTIKKITPFVMVLVACLLILRGMNLGIPYLSPTITETPHHTAINCH